MRLQSSRRAFLKETSARVATVLGLAGCSRFWPASGRETLWTSVPPLDGALLLDEASRQRMSVDLGANFRRIPAAVLRPRSAQDVMTMVRYANTHKLQVAMRGQGHSQYGQTLVKDGIAIDSASLNAVTVEPPGTVYAQVGATWNDVTHATLAHGLTLPALGDTMSLSVGGILSAGGISNSSHRFGAVIDSVMELDIVTGAGELVNCSPDRNRELFELTLGGMGQCALIVGARLRLVQAPAWVVRRELFYDELSAFLSDLRVVATEREVDHLGATVVSRGDGKGFRFVLNVGNFSATPDVDFAPTEAGLRFDSRGDPVPLTYANYLQREAARNAALTAAQLETPRRMGYITMFVPGSAIESFMRRILATPADTAGITRFSLYLLPTRKFSRPMFMLPREEFACAIFLFRNVPASDEARYAEMVATVRRLNVEMRELGGKAYPPYAPFYSAADWEMHYGAAWPRLTSGKREFDPGSVLTPGMRG